MPKICLYAEVLTHIRQLTLHASLQTDGDETPQIDVSSDKKVITVVHGGESSSLWLPTQIAGTANVTFLTPKKTELTARVQIEDLAQWKEFDQNNIEAPWDATELGSDTSIRCKVCQTTILSPGVIESWKDLPSQDWADVMDLWFCHKPHDHHDNPQQNGAAEAKGFSARSKLACATATGMIDLTSFVLHPDDCKNIQIADRANENVYKPVSIFCSGCDTMIGTFSSSDNLIRLHKSDLAVQRGPDESYVSFPASTFIGAQLLSLIESSSLRKVVMYSTEDRAGRTKKERKQGTRAAGDKNEATMSTNGFGLDNQTAGAGQTHQTHVQGDNTSQLYSTGGQNNTSEKEQAGSAPLSSSSNVSRSKDLSAKVEDHTSPSPPETPSKRVKINSPSMTAQGSRKPTQQAQSAMEVPHNEGQSKHEEPDDVEDRSNEDPNVKGLLLWIFNPNIYYSSSLHPANRRTTSTLSGESRSVEADIEGNTEGHFDPATQSQTHPHTHAQAHRAMKVFYQVIPNPEDYLPPIIHHHHSDSSSGSSQNNNNNNENDNHASNEPNQPNQPNQHNPQIRTNEYEDLPLPTTQHLHGLYQTLQKSTQILPAQSRTFQHWHVGLLDRYEKTATAEDVMAQNPLARRNSIPNTNETNTDVDTDTTEQRTKTGTETGTGTKEEEGRKGVVGNGIVVDDGKEIRTYELPAGYQELYL